MGAMKELLTGLRTVPTSELVGPRFSRPPRFVSYHGRRVGAYIPENPNARRTAPGRRINRNENQS